MASSHSRGRKNMGPMPPPKKEIPKLRGPAPALSRLFWRGHFVHYFNSIFDRFLKKKRCLRYFSVFFDRI